MSTPVRVAIVNHPGSGADDAELAKIAAAIDRQVREHFGPCYGLVAEVVFTATPLPTDWVVGCFENADQPGALGYHDMTPHGQPLSKVFPLLDQQDGANLSTTISHEVMEMLADPYLRLSVQDDTGKFWAYEVCDAVEQNEYEIDGVKVSDFVLPAYFEPPTDLTGVQLDWMNLVTEPYQVLEGGYMQWFDSKHGWQQVMAQHISPRPYRMAVKGRRDRRQRRDNRAPELPAA